MKTNPSKQIAFVAVSEYPYYHKAEERVFTDPIWLKGNHIVFISLGELQKFDFKDKYFQQKRLFGSCPGTASSHWQVRLEKGDNTRFSTGMYYSTEHLLFIDDVMEWSHHRREFKDIRTALDIARQLKEEEELCH